MQVSAVGGSAAVLKLTVFEDAPAVPPEEDTAAIVIE